MREAVVLTDHCDAIDWQEVARLFERAPLGTRSAARLQALFAASPVRCFARLGPTVVGAGRAITDRISWALILDVVVAPELQRGGIGRGIVDNLVQRAGARNVMLHAVPGAEEFYRRQGFRRMQTAFARHADMPGAVAGGYVEDDIDEVVLNRGGVWLSV